MTHAPVRRSGPMLLTSALALLLTVLLCGSGCSPRFTLVSPAGSDPFEERTLSGKGSDKILILPVQGFLSLSPGQGLLGERPSPVQEVAAELSLAAEDTAIKAVVLTIDSPGGSVTASDILYDQVMRFKAARGVPVVAALLGLAASGGYYTAIAADRVVAHPTTLTGSIGTIFIRPDLKGLMDKLGLEAEIAKSGPRKDMGSPLRHSQAEERRLLQDMVADLNGRFLAKVQERRGLNAARLATVADGRVFTANQALAVGLVDRIGYVEDALDEARGLAGLEKSAKVVVFRRREFANDTVYNTMRNESPAAPELSLAGVTQALMGVPAPGFYHLWLPTGTPLVP